MDHDALNVSSPCSRRQWLATVAGLSLLLLLAPQGRSLAQGQMTQEVAGYQDKPNGDKRCAGCRFFKAPKSCQLVQGDISPDGWCKFFNAKS